MENKPKKYGDLLTIQVDDLRLHGSSEVLGRAFATLVRRMLKADEKTPLNLDNVTFILKRNDSGLYTLGYKVEEAMPDDP